jgi:hypothetical protein
VVEAFHLDDFVVVDVCRWQALDVDGRFAVEVYGELVAGYDLLGESDFIVS